MNKMISRCGAVLSLAMALGVAASGIAPVYGADAPQVKDTRTNDPSKALSGTYVLDQNHGRILWTYSHNGFSNFFGLLPLVDCTLTLDAANLANTKLTATVHMDAVTTSTPSTRIVDVLKSEEMFNVAQYPTATFISTKVERTAPNKANVTGDLMFRGVTKPVVMETTFIQSGEGPGPGYRIGFEGRATIKRSDFGMVARLPSIGDEVTLTIEGEFMAKPAGQ